MPRPRKTEETGGQDGPLASRVVAKLQKDKDIGGVIKQGNAADLLSTTPYYVSTGIATLDYAIGRPGIPASKLTTIVGREGSGKSTVGYNLLAETQHMGGVAVLIDSEQRYTRERGALMGLNPDELILIDGATAEQSFESIEKIVDSIRADSIDVPVTIVYDSLAGSVPEKRMEGEMGGSLPAAMARLCSQMLPRLKLKISRMGVALVVVNQIRHRVNFGEDPRTARYQERMKVMGAKQTMLAEMSLIFESALIIYMNSTGALGDDREHPTGISTKAVIRKCGISPREGWQAEFDIDFLNGPDKLGSKFDLLNDLGFIKHTSSGWYVSRDRLNEEFDMSQKKFQKNDFAQVLIDRPILETAVREAPTLWEAGLGNGAPSENSTPDDGSSDRRGSGHEQPSEN